MAVDERWIKNELYWRYSRGLTVAECAAQLHISQIWAMHALARLCKGDLYIEGAHMRGKRSKYRKARFIYISERDRHFDHGV